MASIGKYHARHSWRKPRVGDDGIICLTCDRMLPFAEMTGYMASSILRTRRVRYSDSHDFQSAFAEAHLDWKRRHPPIYGIAA